MTTFTSSLLVSLRHSNINVYPIDSKKNIYFFLRILAIPFLALYLFFYSYPLPIVYINSSTYGFFVGLLVIYFNIFGFKTVLSLHHGYQGFSDVLGSSPGFPILNYRFRLTFPLLLSPDHIFCFSDSQYRFFSSHPMLSLSRISHTSSYIQSSCDTSSLSSNSADFSADVRAFLSSSCGTKKFIVSGYGKNYSLFEDVLLAAQKTGLPMSILILAYGAYDPHYMNSIRQLVDSSNKSVNILLLEKTFSRKAFLSLLQHFDVYIRSSGVDSYCYTLSEAIDMGLLTIATSVCNRDHRIPFLYAPGDVLMLSSYINGIISKSCGLPASASNNHKIGLNNTPSVTSLLLSLLQS